MFLWGVRGKIIHFSVSLKWPQLLFYASFIYHYVCTQSHFTLKTWQNCETKCKHLLHHFPKPRGTIDQHMLTRCFSLLIDNHSQTRLLELFLFLIIRSSDWLSLYSLFSDVFLVYKLSLLFLVSSNSWSFCVTFVLCWLASLASIRHTDMLLHTYAFIQIF